MKIKLSLLGLTLFLFASSVVARNHVDVVGSSTLYPLAVAVAKQVKDRVQTADYRIKSTGTVAGIDLFCRGNGLDAPDVLNASRRMRPEDIEGCERHGVKDLVEVKVGYDGVTLANSVDSLDLYLTRRDLYLALAARVPDPAGSSGLVANPYRTWNQVNAGLPAVEIQVLGPPRTSGTRDSFEELALEGGCSGFPELMAIYHKNRKAFIQACRTIRSDGVYREAGEDDEEIAAELAKSRNLVGVFGFHFLEAHRETLKPVRVDDSEPTNLTIASGVYPLSRDLYVYFKTANLSRLPGIQQYIDEFTSEQCWSEKGYLKQQGMIPMLSPERQKYAYIAKNRVGPSCPPFCY